jgi:SAM-dependent methyltransferase
MARSKKRTLSLLPEETGGTKGFWDQQARTHGASDLATNPDHYYRELEIECILRAVKALTPTTILDVGCGNGFTTEMLAKAFPDAEIVAIDYSEAMIDEAIAGHYCDNVLYLVGDVIALSRHKALLGRKFDVVLSTRCLINLANWAEQKLGILEMRKMLNPDGRLILVENIKDGLDNLNDLRVKYGLAPIKVRWHNFYIPQDELTKFLSEISHLMQTEYVENIGNMYYIASRVIYAKLCQDQGVKPDYDHPINKIAKNLPTLGEYYACSPNFLFVLKNVEGLWPPSDRKLAS